MKYKYPKFKFACIENEEIWFVPFGVNAIFKLDIRKEKVYFVTLIPVKKYTDISFGGLYKKNEKLFLMPASWNEFLIYDINKNEFKRIECEYEGRLKFQNCLSEGDDIYFIGEEYALIAKYNIKNEEMHYIDNFKEEDVCKKKEDSFVWSRGIACMTETSILIPNSQNNYILEYNLKRNTYSFRKVEKEGEGFSDIIQVKSEYWLLPRKGKEIIKWKEDENKLHILKIGDVFEFTEYTHMFAVSDAKIFIIDYISLEAFILDVDSNEIFFLELKDRVRTQLKDRSDIAVRWSNVHETKIYINFVDSDCVIEYDVLLDRFRNIAMELDFECQKEYVEILQLEKEVLSDRMPYISIPFLLNYDIEKNQKNEGSGIDETIGKRILYGVWGV